MERDLLLIVVAAVSEHLCINLSIFVFCFVVFSQVYSFVFRFSIFCYVLFWDVYFPYPLFPSWFFLLPLFFFFFFLLFFFFSIVIFFFFFFCFFELLLNMLVVTVGMVVIPERKSITLHRSTLSASFLSISESLTMSLNPYEGCPYLCAYALGSACIDVIDVICRYTALTLGLSLVLFLFLTLSLSFSFSLALSGSLWLSLALSGPCWPLLALAGPRRLSVNLLTAAWLIGRSDWLCASVNALTHPFSSDWNRQMSGQYWPSINRRC